MTGLKITLPTPFTDTTLPKVLDDPILATSGSLLLLDPAHSLGSWGAGVPADGAVIPNIAWQSAKSAIGSGDATTLSSTFRKSAFTATSFVAERSNKGGMHGIVSQVAHVAQQGFYFDFPALLKTYLLANPTHSIYASQWIRTTRNPTASAAANDHAFDIADAGATATNYRQQLFHGTAGQLSTYPDQTYGTAQLIARRVGAVDSNGAVMTSSATSAFTGTNPTNISTLAAFAGKSGSIWPTSGNQDNGNLQTKGSRIFYRVYLEDLTVSGRTYAAVDAIDLTKWTTDFSAGGRFFGDTYTAPSVLA